MYIVVDKLKKDWVKIGIEEVEVGNRIIVRRMNSIEKDEGRKKNEKGGKRKMKIGNKKIERKEEIEGSNEDISRERKWKKKKVIKSGDIDKK